MNNHDNIIILTFFNENKKLSNKYWKFIKRIKKNQYINIQKYLLNRFDDLTINSKTIIKESLYRILNNVEHRNKCPICGQFTKFNPLKENCYNDHCSTSCEMKDHNVMDKHNKTCLEKYGSVNNIKKNKETKKNKYGDENYNNTNKRNHTNLKKYGNICSLHNKDIREKTINTNIQKYGTQYAQSNQLIKEKIKNSNINTCKEKYGVENIMQLQEIYHKQLITKRNNNSFNVSKPENDSYNILSKKYNDVKRQYRSKLYPFNCDFYIPSLDLYIECNYFWTHGNKPFESTKDDIDKLNKWKIKAKINKFYQHAINVWTIADVKKRNIAKQNNLNYIEFWNIQELKKWLNTKKE